MLLREFIVAEVCKYFDNVDIARSLCVCKTLNVLVKKHVTTITDIYSPKYSEFTGLVKVYLNTTKYSINVFPPNTLELTINELNLDFTSWPKHLTALTLNECVNKLSNDVLDLICPTLTKLHIKYMEYNNHISVFTNLQDLNIYTTEEITALPPNLTKLTVDAEDICMDSIWNILPKSLTYFDIECDLQNVYMKDLPKSLKMLDIRMCDINKMRECDYFNIGIEKLRIDIDMFDNKLEMFSRLPKTLVSIDILAYNIGVNLDELIKLLPRTLLELRIRTDQPFTRNFYTSLPPTLLCLNIGNESYAVVYPSLLPRSLTKLQNKCTKHLYVDNCNDLDFPPNIKIMRIEFYKNHVHTVDFSNLTHLYKLWVRGNMHIIAPQSLRHFEGILENIKFNDGLISCRDTSGITSAITINNLPKSVMYLRVDRLNNYDTVIYPPNIRTLDIYYAELTIEQLNNLPSSLELLMQYKWSAKLIRTIDGRVWITPTTKNNNSSGLKL